MKHTATDSSLNASIMIRPRHSRHSHRVTKNRRILLATIAASLFASSAHAAAVTWVGATTAWNTGTNWSSTPNPPVTGDSLVFGAAGAGGTTLNNDLTSTSFNVAGITYNAGSPAYTIGGNAFVLTGNVVNSGSNLQTINSPISMTAARTFTTGAGGISLGGVISGSSGGITKAVGAGTLTIGGNNTFTGGIVFANAAGTAGNLRLTSSTALGLATTAKTINMNSSNGTASGAIELTNNITVALKHITIGGRSSISAANAQLRNVSGNNAWNGNITIAATGGSYGLDSVAGTLTLGGTLSNTVADSTRTLQLYGAGNYNITGSMVNAGTGSTGEFGIIMRGTGTLTLAPSTHTATGGITLNSGTLNLNNAVALGGTGGTFTINGGTIDSTATFTNQTLTTNNTQTWNANVAFTGTNSLNLGTGAVSLGTAAGTSRTVTVNANTLTVGGVIADGTTAIDLIKAGAGTLTLGGNNTYSGTTTISAGTLQIGNAGTTGTFGLGNVTNNSIVSFNRTNNTLVVANNIGGTGVVNQIGTGTTSLSGTNTYGGGTNVNTGILSYRNTSAQPATGNTNVLAGATLGLGVGGAGFYSTADIDNLIANTMTNVTLDAAAQVGIDTTAGDYTHPTTLTQPRSIVKLGVNKLTLPGDNTFTGNLSVTAGELLLTGANTYTGSTTVNAGTLTLSGGNDRLPVGTAFVLGNGGTLDVGATTQTLNSFAVPAATTMSATVTGAGGTLNLNQANLLLGPTTTANPVTLNFAGLTNLNYNNATGTFRVGPTSSPSSTTAQVATVTLAQNNTITATNLFVADQGGSAGAGASTLNLGQTNILNVNSINVGFSNRSSGTLQLATGLTNPTVTIRGVTGGSSAVATFDVAKGQNNADVLWTSTVNFADATLDANVTAMRLGVADNGTAATRRGTVAGNFTMGKGVLNVDSLSIGEIIGTTGTINASPSTFGATGNFTINDATGVVNATTITMATNTIPATGGAARTVAGNFNLTNGTLRATTITKGTQTGTATSVTTNFNWTTGTIENTTGANLTITDIPITLLTGADHTFNVTGTNTTTVGVGSPISGATSGIIKQGPGTLVMEAANTYGGGTTISAGTVNVSHGGGLGTGAVVNNSILNLTATTATNYTFGAVSGNGAINITLGTGSDNANLQNATWVGYTGIINVGVSQAPGSGKAQLNGSLPATATVNVTPNSTVYATTGSTHNAPLTLYGGDTGESFGQLRLDGTANWAGQVTLDGVMDPSDFTIGNGSAGTNSTISGNIVELNGPRDLSKGGIGAVTLSGTNNYTGLTTVSVGRLQFANLPSLYNGSIATGIAKTSVASGATLSVNVGGVGEWTAPDINTLFTGLTTGITTNGLKAGSSFGFDTSNAGGSYTNSIVITDSTGTGAGAVGLAKVGTGTLVLGVANTYTGNTTLSGGSLNLGVAQGVTTGPLGGGSGSLPTGSIVFDGGTLQYSAVNTTDYSSIIAATTTPISIDTNGQTVTFATALDGTHTGGLTKLGSGTLNLNAANTYTGGTNINGGTLNIGVTNALDVTGAVTMNSTGSGSTPATLTVNNDQTIGSLTVKNTAATSGNADVITIASGKTLTVNGNATFGLPATATTFATISGAGTLAVTNPGGTFQVGGAIGSTNSNGVTVDMGGLTTFNAALGTTGTFRVGDVSSATGTVGASTVTLANSSTITAGTISLGGSTGSATLQTLRLGSTDNFLYANTISVGSTSSRGSGLLNFATGTGTLKVRSATDIVDGRADMNLVNSTSTTAVNMTAEVNLLGHAVDLKLGTLALAVRTGASGGGSDAKFSFDTGTLDVTTIGLAGRAGTGTSINTAELNIAGGTALIGSITMAGAQTTQTATGTLNLTGGVTTLAGTITKLGGGGFANATVNLDGGTLNMGAFSIGDANVVTLNAKSGTLLNLAELNSGGTLTKSAANLLTVGGFNTYTGAVAITDGTFRATTDSALGTTAAGTSVSSGAVLSLDKNGGSDLVIGNEALTLNGGGLTASPNGALRNVSGNNSYSGVITLGSASSIQSDAGQLLTLSGGIDTAAVVLTVQGAGNTMISGGAIIGSGGFTKSGSGIATLSNDNTYTGPTTVNSGTLNLTTATTNNIPTSSQIALGGGTLDVTAVTGAGGFALASNQILSGAGTVSGSLTAGATTEVRPGGTGVAGTLNFGPLTLSGAGLTFDLGTASDLINLSSNLLTGTGTNTFTLNSLTGFGIGNYTLIDYGTLAGGTSLSNFALSSPTLAGFNVALSDTGSAIVLNVTAGPGGTTIWQGANNDNWTLASSWTGSVPNSAFAEAKFESTGGTTANLDANQIVNKLTFDSTAPHTISGANTLTLAGTSPVISTAATNTGTQTVAVHLDLAAGTTVSVQGGTLELNSPTNATLGTGVTATVATGATLNLGGAGNALSNGTSTHANVTNNGTLAATTAGKRVGTIDGTGTTTVTAAGANLTASHVRQAGLTIGAGNKVTVAVDGTNSGTSTVTNLSINATGKLDLNDNDLVVDGGNLATLTAQLASGLDVNGTYGNGPGGITSTAFANNPNFNTVLGIAPNSDLAYSTFSGQTVDANDVLIKYTYYGDADLNGLVDAATDFDLYITGLTSGGSFGGWLFGDFDYNGSVDAATDFDLYITGLTSQGAPLLTAGSGSPITAIPEPSTLVLAGLGVLGFAGAQLRRRRTRCQ